MGWRLPMLVLPLALACAAEPVPVVPATRDDGALSLFPSRDEVRSLDERRQARELEQTLVRLDGVEGARVHLTLADPSLLSRDREQPSSAAILITGDGAWLPDEGMIRLLVAAAVPGLDEARVNVFFTGGYPAEKIVSVGPIRVAASSAGVARGVIGGLLGTCVALAAVLIWAGIRLRRRRR